MKESVNAENGDPGTVGGFKHFRFVDENHATCAERETSRAAFRQPLDRFYPHDRHISAAIMIVLRGFQQRPSLRAAKLTGTLDHAVRPFHRLDGNHIAITHRDGLADIELHRLGKQRPTEINIRALLGGRFDPAHDAGRCKVIRDEFGRVDERDS